MKSWLFAVAVAGALGIALGVSGAPAASVETGSPTMASETSAKKAPME
jgi:hypothetical protein